MEDHVVQVQVHVQVPVPEVQDMDVKMDRISTEKMVEAHHVRLPDWDPERETRAVGVMNGCCLVRCMDLGPEGRRKRPLAVVADAVVESQRQEDIDHRHMMDQGQGQGQGQDDKLEIRLGVGIEDRDCIDIGSNDKVVAGVDDYVADLVDTSLADPDNDGLLLEQKVEDHIGLVVDYIDLEVEASIRTGVDYLAEKQEADADCLRRTADSAVGTAQAVPGQSMRH